MGGRTNSVPISGEKLTREIRKTGESKCVVSSNIGYSRSYLANCCYLGEISKSALLLLEQMYGISYDSVKPETGQIEPDNNLVRLSESQMQKEKIEFFETCEEKISNAVVTLNVCLDMIDQLLVIRERVENDMRELMTVQEVYQKTLKRVKEAS